MLFFLSNGFLFLVMKQQEAHQLKNSEKADGSQVWLTPICIKERSPLQNYVINI